jgi:hypothetical protein
MLPFFQNIVGFLNKEEIPYMLTGSVAMSIYIVPRATKDMDFVAALKKEDIDKIAARFGKEYYCDRDAMADALRRKMLFNIIDTSTGFKADFIPLNQTAYEQTKFSRRRETDFLGSSIYVISPEDLIVSKLVWIQQLQSAQQIVDIENLLAIENLDQAYISHWVNALHLTTFGLL